MRGTLCIACLLYVLIFVCKGSEDTGISKDGFLGRVRMVKRTGGELGVGGGKALKSIVLVWWT